MRSRLHSVTLHGGLDRRWLTDRMDSVSSVSKRNVTAFSLGGVGQHHHARGLSYWGATFSVGRADIDTPAVRAADALGPRTHGSYTKALLHAGHSHVLGSGWRLHGRLAGQVAGQNLDSSEKFSLGGAQGVRAHPQGEALGDQGWLGRLELRHAASSQWDWGLGYDHGQVQIDKSPYAAGRNRLTRRGLAVGVDGRLDRVNLSATLAWRVGAASTSARDSRARLWVQADWAF